MLRAVTKTVLVLALGATPVMIVPRSAHAQTSAEQRAYQAGFQNGVNDRNQNKPLNLKTDNWHRENLSVYRRGYEEDVTVIEEMDNTATTMDTAMVMTAIMIATTRREGDGMEMAATSARRQVTQRMQNDAPIRLDSRMVRTTDARINP